MPLRVPMAVAQGRVWEAVQGCFVRIDVRLQRPAEVEHEKALPPAQRQQPIVRIKQVVYANRLHETLAVVEFWIDLNADGRDHDHESYTAARHLVMELADRGLADLPRLFPGRIGRWFVDRRVDSQLRALGQRTPSPRQQQRPAHLAQDIENLGVAAFKAHPTVKARMPRLDKWPAQRKPAVVKNGKGPALVGLQSQGVLLDVVAWKCLEDDKIRSIAPHLLPERHQFLGGVVTIDAEVEHFDLFAMQSRTAAQKPLHHR